MSNEKKILVNSLKHNLLIINQIYDKRYKIIFNYECCLFLKDDKLIYIGNRKRNVYKIKIDAYMRIKSCLVTSINDSFLWHKRLGYISIDILSKLVKNDLVKGLPYIAFKKEKLCDAFRMCKQIKTSFKRKIHISTNKPLELLPINLFRPTRTRNISGNRYVFIVIDGFTRYTWFLFFNFKDETIYMFDINDDFTRYTWVLFLKYEDETIYVFVNFSYKVKNEKGFP